MAYKPGVKPTEKQQALAPSYLFDQMKHPGIMICAWEAKEQLQNLVGFLSIYSYEIRVPVSRVQGCAVASLHVLKEHSVGELQVWDSPWAGEPWSRDVGYPCRHSSITPWCRRCNLMADLGTALVDFYVSFWISWQPAVSTFFQVTFPFLI